MWHKDKLNSRLSDLITKANNLGYDVKFVDYCEDNITPGILGLYGGICDKERKIIKIRTKGMTFNKIKHILIHEIEHAEGAFHATDFHHLGLKCGEDKLII